MRAGSTFLRSYFSQHPQIAWTRRAWRLQLGQSDQERRRDYCRAFQFCDPGRCLIDMYEGLCLGQYFKVDLDGNWMNRQTPVWSPDWAMAPEGQLRSGPVAVDPAEIARRIRDCVPKGKVLLVLRNQVDWLRSMYVHYLNHLPPRQRRFSDFLNTREGKSALDAGLFDRMLGALFRTFKRDRVHVMLLEALARDEEASLRDLCRFLEVDYHPCDSSQLQRNGQRGDAISAARGRLWGALARLGWKQIDVLRREEKAFLRAFYSASNARTAQLLSLDLSEYGYPG